MRRTGRLLMKVEPHRGHSSPSFARPTTSLRSAPVLVEHLELAGAAQHPLVMLNPIALQAREHFLPVPPSIQYVEQRAAEHPCRPGDTPDRMRQEREHQDRPDAEQTEHGYYRKRTLHAPDG